MMYYIDTPQTLKAANRKCAEIQEFVDQFRNCLIKDDLSRDAMALEIRRKVTEMNDAYPRTKRLVVEFSDNYLSCFPEGRGADYEYVFIIMIHPVRRTYRFAENANVLQEGGEQ